MRRFWEIVFCVPLLFCCHFCLSKKHAPSRNLPLTTHKTVFSHLQEYPQKSQIWKSETIKSQPGNLVGNSLVGTCLTLPNLGFLWVFFKYPKISNIGNLLFFPVSSRPLIIPMCNSNVCVVVQFYPWFNFYFPLFLGMVMYYNEFRTKENKN